MADKNEVRRRCDIQRMTPAELAIRNAMLEVEKLPAGTQQTNTVILLSEAQRMIAAHIDGEEWPLEIKAGPVQFFRSIGDAEDARLVVAQLQSQIEAHLPASRERSLAQTKLDEARMWLGEVLHLH